MGLIFFHSPTALAVHTDEEARALVASDLIALTRVQFKNVSPNHLKMFGSNDGSGLVRYITERIKTVNHSDSYDRTAETSELDKRTSIADSFFILPQVERWATLLHESRHVDGIDHGWCPEPFVFSLNGEKYSFAANSTRGTLNCDDDDKGAYGYMFTFLMSIANSCTNCSAKTKQLAMGYSSDALIRINHPACALSLVEGSLKNPKEFLASFPIRAAGLEKAYEKRHAKDQ